MILIVVFAGEVNVCSLFNCNSIVCFFLFGDHLDGEVGFDLDGEVGVDLDGEVGFDLDGEVGVDLDGEVGVDEVGDR